MTSLWVGLLLVLKIVLLDMKLLSLQDLSHSATTHNVITNFATSTITPLSVPPLQPTVASGSSQPNLNLQTLIKQTTFQPVTYAAPVPGAYHQSPIVAVPGTQATLQPSVPLGVTWPSIPSTLPSESIVPPQSTLTSPVKTAGNFIYSRV